MWPGRAGGLLSVAVLLAGVFQASCFIPLSPNPPKLPGTAQHLARPLRASSRPGWRLGKGIAGTRGGALPRSESAAVGAVAGAGDAAQAGESAGGGGGEQGGYQDLGVLRKPVEGMEPSWRALLDDEFHKEYFRDIARCAL